MDVGPDVPNGAPVLGTSWYGDGSAWVLLAPNTTATKKFYTMTGTGTVGAAPVWSTIAVADLPVMSATVGGAVPTPPNDATKFLDGTGVFAVPSGGGGVWVAHVDQQTTQTFTGTPSFDTDITGSSMTITGATFGAGKCLRITFQITPVGSTQRLVKLSYGGTAVAMDSIRNFAVARQYEALLCNKTGSTTTQQLRWSVIYSGNNFLAGMNTASFTVTSTSNQTLKLIWNTDFSGDQAQLNDLLVEVVK